MIDQNLISNKSKQFEQEVGVSIDEFELFVLIPLRSKINDYKRFMKHIKLSIAKKYAKKRNMLHAIIVHRAVIQKDDYRMNDLLCFDLTKMSKHKDEGGRTPVELLFWFFEAKIIDIGRLLSTNSMFADAGVDTFYTLLSHKKFFSPIPHYHFYEWKIVRILKIIPLIVKMHRAIINLNIAFGVFQSEESFTKYLNRIAPQSENEENQKKRGSIEQEFNFRTLIVRAFANWFYDEGAALEIVSTLTNRCAILFDKIKESEIKLSPGRNPSREVLCVIERLISFILEIKEPNNPLMKLSIRVLEKCCSEQIVEINNLNTISIRSFPPKVFCTVYHQNICLLETFIKCGINLNFVDKRSIAQHCNTTPKTILDLALKRPTSEKNEKIIKILKENSAFTYAELEEKKRANTTTDKGFCT